MKILFVCSSNICRSPYCDFWFQRYIKEDPKLAQIVTSVKSGAVKFRYKHIYEPTAQCLIDEGFNPNEVYLHKPRHKWFESEIFKEADVIIGMTTQHYVLLPRKYKKKYVHLSTLVKGQYEPIADPWWDKKLTQSQFFERLRDIRHMYLEPMRDKLLSGEITLDNIPFGK